MKQKYDLSGNIFSDKYLNLRKRQIKKDKKKKSYWKFGKTLRIIKKKKKTWDDTFGIPFYLDKKESEEIDTCLSFPCCGIGILIIGGGLIIISLLIYISIKK
jgi:hypothetical protein